MTIMDITIVNVALPTIGRDFDVPPASVASVSIAFLVSLAVFMPASGWLGDRFGGKRVLLGAIVVFTIASALCGLAQPHRARHVPGPAGRRRRDADAGRAGDAVPRLPPAERIRAAGILTVPTTLAPAVGPVLGGLLVTELSWRWVFYVNVPIGVSPSPSGVFCTAACAAARPLRPAGFLLPAPASGCSCTGCRRARPAGAAGCSPRSQPARAAGRAGGRRAAQAPAADRPAAAGQPAVPVEQRRDVLASVGVLGTLYVVSLFLQDGGACPRSPRAEHFPGGTRGDGRCAAGQPVIYPGSAHGATSPSAWSAVAASIALMSLVGGQTSLWWCGC